MVAILAQSPPSTSGLGRSPFKAVARVRIPSGAFLAARATSDRGDDSVGDEVELGFRHMAEQRQRQYPTFDRIRLGKKPLCERSVVREGVDRRVMDARLDAFAPQPLLNIVTASLLW